MEMSRFRFLYLFLFIYTNIYAQDSINKNAQIPFEKVFYKIDKHFLGSFECHYGLNYALACACTYGVVKSGIDWKWYNFSNDHKWVSNAGFVSVGAGGIVPIFAPLGLYLYGKFHHNSELQVTGLALGQAAILGLAISSTMKVFTGRVPPDYPEKKTDYSGDFRFGFLRGGAYEGWPSTHTTIAFSLATTLAELYPHNTIIKICSFTYASLIGLGVSTNIHWFSDAVAGAFIGYAIGKSVGTGFRNLHNGSPKNHSSNFYLMPTGFEFTYQF
jgi:membrane-associated phospholipid phosphatase